MSAAGSCAGKRSTRSVTAAALPHPLSFQRALSNPNDPRGDRNPLLRLQAPIRALSTHRVGSVPRVRVWYSLPLQELLLLLPVGVNQLLRDQLHQLQALLYLHQDLEVLPASHLQEGASPGIRLVPVPSGHLPHGPLFPPNHISVPRGYSGLPRTRVHGCFRSCSHCLCIRIPILPHITSPRCFSPPIQAKLSASTAHQHLQARNTSPPPRAAAS